MNFNTSCFSSLPRPLASPTGVFLLASELGLTGTASYRVCFRRLVLNSAFGGLYFPCQLQFAGPLTAKLTRQPSPRFLSSFQPRGELGMALGPKCHGPHDTLSGVALIRVPPEAM